MAVEKDIPYSDLYAEFQNERAQVLELVSWIEQNYHGEAQDGLYEAISKRPIFAKEMYEEMVAKGARPQDQRRR